MLGRGQLAMADRQSFALQNPGSRVSGKFLGREDGKSEEMKGTNVTLTEEFCLLSAKVCHLSSEFATACWYDTWVFDDDGREMSDGSGRKLGDC